MFLSMLGTIDLGIRINRIHQFTRREPMEEARFKVFQMQLELMKRDRGDAKMVFEWYGGTANEVETVFTHGFRMPTKFPSSAPYGVGVYLSHVKSPHISVMLSQADNNKEKHIILCRVILGNCEKIEAGSHQAFPSSVEYDTGIDDLMNPKWYKVWVPNMNTRITPEYVVSFKTIGLGHVVQPDGNTMANKLFTKLRSSLPPPKSRELQAEHTRKGSFRPAKIAMGSQELPYHKGDISSFPIKKVLLCEQGLEDVPKELPTLRLLCCLADPHENIMVELSGFGSLPGGSVTSGLVTSKKPSLVFLIETKLCKHEWNHIKKKVRLPNALIVEARGRKGGLALLWPRNLQVEVKSFSTHHMEALIWEGEGDPWRFIGFDGNHEAGNHKHSWNLMTLVNGLSKFPTVVMGDFNEVLNANEHFFQRRQRPNWQTKIFCQVVHDCGMFDLWYSSFPFTWCNNFISPFSTRARLDRSLANQDCK
ncbi:hypothetical protein LIER_38448 [Lithospermum erythrorhizon]|uniref:PARP catalytic domain-containing protein n=1 Tax=Lithospermum erythrorhizon TaxID=34254 RepID=A0AAV3Q2B7_LITER